jgi:tetratricopeptide (TPR) repeat protein
VWTAPYAIWWYIRHLVTPWGLSVEYAAKVLDRPTLSGFVLPGVVLLFLVAISWWLWRRQRSPVAAFLIFWFAVTLTPPVILAPMVSEHDRYLYIPSYAFCALVAWAILYLGKVTAKVRLVAALVVVALWSGLTWHEMSYWDCDKTLWSRVLEISPSEPKAQLQLALIYNYQVKDIPKALSILDDGLRYHPNSLKFHLVRAEILYGNKQFDEARTEYLKIMQLTEPKAGCPVEAGIPTSLRAAAASQLALLDISARDFVEAERYARTAISLVPDGVGYHSILSRTLAGEGRPEESKAENALELRLRLAQQRDHGLSAHP